MSRGMGRSGRAPSKGRNPTRAGVARVGVSSIAMSLAPAADATRRHQVHIARSGPTVRWWKTTMSRYRLRNFRPEVLLRCRDTCSSSDRSSSCIMPCANQRTEQLERGSWVTQVRGEMIRCLKSTVAHTIGQPGHPPGLQGVWRCPGELLDLVEQHHRERLAATFFGEMPNPPRNHRTGGAQNSREAV